MEAAPRTAVTEDDEPTEDEHGHPIGSDIERVEKGFAPLYDPSNPKRRERREEEAQAAIDAAPKQTARTESPQPSKASR